uniref:Uncharacterized protein n=1 Tax=Brassica oleracea TaxID=3712 RepID=A0A3P6FCA2_BRAOL|nr:unnamed protein product [Brassica oleracea]
MREEIKELKQLIMGKMTVAKYKRFFYSLPIVGERTEQQLILLAKAGLKEKIRDGLETEEFATLEALFEEAEEVEEGLKETPPSSPGKRRRTSPDHRSSKRDRKAEKKGDPEDEGYGYPGEGETGLKDNEEGDYGSGCRWTQTWMTTLPTGPDDTLGSAVRDGQLLETAPHRLQHLRPTRNLLLF